MLIPFIIHIPLLFFIIYFFYKNQSKQPLGKYFFIGITTKLTTGICVGLIFRYYYRDYMSDTLLIQNYSEILTKILYEKPEDYFNIMINDFYSDWAKNMILTFEKIKTLGELGWGEGVDERLMSYSKILSLLNIFTFSNYWINGFYLSLFSFTGLWYFSNLITKLFKLPYPSIFFSFILFPSFAFWTSGVLKETFLTGSIFLISYVFLKFNYQKDKFNYFLIPLILFLLYTCWKIKFFYILLLLPILFSYYISILLRDKFSFLQKSWLIYILYPVIFMAIIFSGIEIVPSISIDYLTNIIYLNYEITQRISHEVGKFAYEFSNFGPNISSFAYYFPKALLIGLFRPFIWESHADISFLIGLENFAVATLFITQIISCYKLKFKISLEIFVLIIFIMISAAFMSFISPNWGTLSRYKTLYMPFFIFLLTNKNLYFEKITDYIEKHFFKKFSKA